MTNGIQRKLQNSAIPKLTKELKKNALLAQKNQLFALENQLTLAQVVQNITNPAQDNTNVTYFSNSRYFGPAIPRSAQKLLAAAYIKEIGQKKACTSDGHFAFDKFKAHFENHENKNYRSVARHLKESYFKKIVVVEVGMSTHDTKNEDIYFAPAKTHKAKLFQNADLLSKIASFLPTHEQARLGQVNSPLNHAIEKKPTPQFLAHKNLGKTLLLEHKHYPELNTHNWRELINKGHIVLEAAVELAKKNPRIISLVSTGNIEKACFYQERQALALLEKIGIQPHENVGYIYGTLLTGIEYTGQWKEGAFHGKGFSRYVNGGAPLGFYTGNFFYNQIHGQGTYNWPDGNTYTGEWANSQQHGQGTFTFKNKDSYTALFQNHRAVGQTTFTFKNGTVYQGGYDPYQFLGPASVQFPNGQHFEGNFIYNVYKRVSEAQGVLKDSQGITQENCELTINFDGRNPTKITRKIEV